MNTRTLGFIGTTLIVAALAGCATKKTDDSAQAGKATAPAEATPAAGGPDFTPPPAPAQSLAPVPATRQQAAATTGTAAASSASQGAAGAAAGPADGFENDAANYTGDTRTGVIYFAFDKADIPAAAYATLKAHAKHLAGNPSARVTLQGHCDERGTPEYNIALGERRAKTLKNFLVLNGAADAQVELVSYGEEKPAELGHDEMAWAKNRRGEIVYTAGNP